jgi:hypothetical protein
MPVDIPCGGDSRPVYLRMPQEQFLREPPRRFRDDLQCNAEGRWSRSNGSAPLSFDYGLRQFPPCHNHDTIFLIPIPARARTPSPHTCVWVACRMAERPRTVLLPTPATRPRPIDPLASPSLLRLHHHSKPIASAFHNGFLQVAVSKTLRRWAFLHPPEYPAAGVFPKQH